MERDKMTIGSYVLLSEIGKGSFGSVFLCKHISTHQSFAGKLFSLEFIKEGNGWLMIDQEVEVLKLLTHQRTIKYQDIVYSPYGILVVMELVCGRSLMKCFPADGGFVESFARLVFKQLLEAIDFLHNNGIVHRDIKLENVMLTKSGDLKLIDYGLSEYFPNSNGDRKKLLVGGLDGSPHYFAPELLKGACRCEKLRGDRVDIWAAGIVLYTLVSDFLPFTGEDDSAIYEDILTRDVSFDDTGFSAELEDLVSNILMKDPEQRASITDIIAHPWMKGRQTHPGCTTFYGKRRKIRTDMADKIPELTRSCYDAFPQRARKVDYGVKPRSYMSCNGRFLSENTGKVMELKYPLVKSGSSEKNDSHETSCTITPNQGEGQGTKKMWNRVVNVLKNGKRSDGVNTSAERVAGESDHEAMSHRGKNLAKSSPEASDRENDVSNENNGGWRRQNVFTRVITWFCRRCRGRCTNPGA